MEQKTERIRESVYRAGAEQFLFVKEAPLFRHCTKDGINEFFYHFPHLLRGVLSFFLSDVCFDSRFFLLIPLQFFHQFHNGVTGFVVLPVVGQQILFLLHRRRKVVMDDDVCCCRFSFLYSAFNIALLIVVLISRCSLEELFPKSNV